ncbi:MAG: prepilin peptidase, partial [Pseudomonadota bacterium]
MSSVAASFALASFPLFLAAAAISDFRRYIIPNWTCLGLLLGFFAAAAAAAVLGPGMTLEAFGLHLASGAAALTVGFALFAFGVWGGGDGKLLAAACLWFDPASALTVAFAATIIGGVWGLAAILIYAQRHALCAIAPGLARLDFEALRHT